MRSRSFWVRGLSNAWHSREGVSDELVDAYRLPQLVRGWEVGLVRFVRARVAGEIDECYIMQLQRMLELPSSASRSSLSSVETG